MAHKECVRMTRLFGDQDVAMSIHSEIADAALGYPAV